MLKRYDPQHVWVDGKRHYVTPGGEKFPGVTSVLSATRSDRDVAGLERWRKQVGHDEAARISKTAADNGTALHGAIEQYLSQSNEPICLPRQIIGHWVSIFPELKRVSEVHLLEGAVWHPEGYAGSVDCVGVFDDELSIVDWKTSAKPKKTEWIKDYYLQTAAYCAAVNRLYDLQIKHAAIVIALPHEKAQVFKVDGMVLVEHWREFQRRLGVFKKQAIEIAGAIA